MPMHPEVERALRTFILAANKGMLHPLDMGRFYDFVRLCHQHETYLLERDLEEHLQREGFSAESASRLACGYDHCRKLLTHLKY